MEKKIGKYKILCEVGKGGMGIIYKGIDPVDKKSVAIKSLPPTLVNRSSVERFNREAMAMSRLKHPNMIKVYEFGMAKGEHFLAMEFIEGENLKTIINQRKRLSTEETLNLASQVGEALAYIHDAGMIHRDIKPGNIMIAQNGRVKVMDLGLVKIPGITQMTVEGSSLGTAEYMSPEQASGEEVDLRTDIYSLGVTMYEMATGRPPFAADTLQALLMKHKYEYPAPVRSLCPDVSQGLEDIITKAMAKDISQRYQSVREMLYDMNRLSITRPAILEEAQTIINEERASSPPPVKKSHAPAMFGILIIMACVALVYIYRAEVSSFLARISRFGAKAQGIGLVSETERYLEKLEKAEEHYTRGLQFSRKGSIEEAIEEYEMAVNLRTDYALYHKDLALAYEQKKDYKKAVKAWKNLLQYDASSSHGEMAYKQIEKLMQK